MINEVTPQLGADVFDELSTLLTALQSQDLTFITRKNKKLISKIQILIEEKKIKMLKLEPFLDKLKFLQSILNRNDSLNKKQPLLTQVLDSVRADYKKLRDYAQELADITNKINKSGKTKKEIAELLQRGVTHKLNTDNAAVLKEFYILFINHAFCLRELTSNNLDSNEYEQILFVLQEKLLNHPLIDLNDYLNVLLQLNKKGKYSTELLLRHFSTFSNVSMYVANQAEECSQQISSYLYDDTFDKKNETLDCFALLALQLPKKEFKIFLNVLLGNNQLTLFATYLYAQGIKQIAHPNKEEVKKKVRLLFDFLHEQNEAFFLMSLINKTNSEETRVLLSELYGQPITIISHFISTPEDIRYCLSPLFFFFLNQTTLIDCNVLSLFTELVFSIAMSDKKEKPPEAYLELSQLKTLVNKPLMNVSVKQLLELYKLLPNVGRATKRLTYANQALISHAKQALISTCTVQADVIRDLLNNNSINKKQLCLTLAKSLKLHLIKNMPLWFELLGTYNNSFSTYVSSLEQSCDLNKVFDENLNIPYYVSASLLNRKRYRNEEERQLIVKLLFKIFLTIKTQNAITNLDAYTFKFKKLIEALSDLTVFYQDDKYIAFRKKAFDHLLDGLGNYSHDTLDARIDSSASLVKNFTNYNLSHIDEIIAHNLSNGKEEIIATFDKVMARGQQSLEEWLDSTSTIGDKLYFIRCYYTYNETDFDTNFQSLNPGLEYECLKKEREKVKANLFENRPLFKSMKIEYFQHNQVGALALVEHHLKTYDCNLFMKIGTGQGKSLIIAETARRIIQSSKAKQVFVVTCYNHLAERDYEKHEKYFHHFNINVTLCSSKRNSASFKQAQVIYTELNTYFDLLRKESDQLLTGQKVSIHFPQQNETALIMDEFDSLILDAAEIYQNVSSFHLACNDKDVEDSETLKAMLNPKGDFLKQCNHEFENLFNNWLERKRAEERNKEDSSIQNNLGEDITFAPDFLSALKQENRAQFMCHYLNPLCFYQQFNRVIGLSGSISQEETAQFNELFTPMKFYNIPPFFGITTTEKNRVNTYEQTISNDKSKYIQAIINDIHAHKDAQPILIFADSIKVDENPSVFDLIKARLEEEFSKSAHQLLYISDEKHINKNLSQIGRRGSITLSTRIMARGADIKIDKELKEGLHAILTYYPKTKSIYTQMLGRVARQDEKGSYSIIVQQDKKFEIGKRIKITAVPDKVLHHSSQRFFQQISKNNTRMKGDLKWPLLSDMLFRWSNTKNLNEHEFQTKVDRLTQSIIKENGTT